jgi:hypothetical protein
VLPLGPTPPARACGPCGLAPFPAGLSPLPAQTPRRSPGSCGPRGHPVSKRARALRLRGAVRRLACIAAAQVAFAVRYQLGAPDFFFRSSITRPTYAPVYASMAASRRATQDSGSGWIATSFQVRLFHSLLHAGFDRAHNEPILEAEPEPDLPLEPPPPEPPSNPLDLTPAPPSPPSSPNPIVIIVGVPVLPSGALPERPAAVFPR